MRLWPLRDFADDTHRRVDDRPFGGGPGMVMLVEPLRARAARRVRADTAARAPLVHFTPTGRRIDQALVQRVRGRRRARCCCAVATKASTSASSIAMSTLELSLGDFVLSGGELPALALLDAVARLQPGVLERRAVARSRTASPTACSTARTTAGPKCCDGRTGRAPVPAVLLSGHHAEIARWRRERSLELTARRRPDLIAAARAAGRL